MSGTVLDPVVIGLLLLAALMHASWNALLKSEVGDRLAMFGTIMLAGCVLGLPMLPFLPVVDPAAWKWLVASVTIHLFYYFFLLKAYSYGDLSHTYPIARGLGPLLVALISGRFLGEALRVQDVVGVVLLSCGLVALALPQRRALRTVVAGAVRVGPAVASTGQNHAKATLFAVLTGVSIACYIVADGLGVRAAGPSPEHRIAYIVWLNIFEGPWLLILAFARRPAATLFHLRRAWWKGAIGGSVAALGYGIAIYALSLGPMAHVAALRETSVLFGALMGALLLGEPFGGRRVVAAGVIVAGLVLMNGPPLF